MNLNILSVFDGIGCGYYAAKLAGFNVTKYLASEIDKYPIKIAKKHIPNYKEIGDVRKLRGIDFVNVDIIIGGSPCQGFSIAGKRKGMIMKNIIVTSLDQYLNLIKDGYEFDISKSKNQSVLFWEFVRLIKEINEAKAALGKPPVFFLLENVKTYDKDWIRIISEALGYKPVKINSKLLLPQNRERFYWANFPITIPEDLKPTLSMYIPGAVTGAGWRGRKLKGDSFYTLLLTIRKDFIANCITTWPSTNKIKGTNFYTNIKDEIVPFTMEDLEVLQGYPKGFTEGIPDKERRKAIGNGWTIPVIQHIFECLKKEIETKQGILLNNVQTRL